MDNVTDRKKMFQLIVDTRNKDAAPVAAAADGFRVQEVASKEPARLAMGDTVIQHCHWLVLAAIP